MVLDADLRRSRATTFFRWLLAIPHFLWIGIWGFGILLLLPVQWIATLVRGRPIDGLHELYAMYLRYTLHVYLYASLAAEPFPGFLGRPRSYPIDLEMPPPQPQRRWSVAFRGVLVLPPLVFAGALGSGIVTSLGTAVSVGAGLATVALVLAWFACLARGAMPEGLRDVLVWTTGYAVQVLAYLFLVTGAFPDSDPRAAPLTPRAVHPVRMRNDDEPRRHRLLVLLRFALVVPHIAWSALWAVAALFAGFAAWASGIALGRVPRPLHRFLAAFVRYQAHVTAFAYLAGGPFPGFLGRPGTYPIDVHVDDAGRQSRWAIGLRGILALPALALAGAAGTILGVGAVGAWCFALVTGRISRGLHRALAYCVRYSAQAYAYAFLLTPAYPHSGPSEEERVPLTALERFLSFPERP